MGSQSVIVDERDIVLEHICFERNREVVRTVKPTRLGLDRLKFLWEKLQEFDVLFNDYVRGDFAAFVNHFIQVVDGEYRAAGLMWDVDDVGMFFLNEIRPMVSGTAHFVFWDKRFRGREGLCREMLHYAFNTYGFQRIQTEVPLYAKKTMAATEKIGFIQEGRIRRAVPYKDSWVDVNIYSVLPEDLEDIPNNPSAWRHRRLACWGCGQTFSKQENINAQESVDGTEN